MTVTLCLWLFVWLSVKHLIIDFPLQGPYQYMNKGTYGHPGGIQHSTWHGGGTILVFWLVAGRLDYAIVLGAIDGIIHYHIDWAKVNVNKLMKWGPTTHEEFWWALGVDQFLHMLTYIGLVYAASIWI